MSSYKILSVFLVFGQVLCEVDQIMLTMQMPAGVCRSDRGNCVRTLDGMKNFTILSARPNPEAKNCPVYDNFDENRVSKIRNELNEAWPSLENNDSVGVWTKEWTSHGNCFIENTNLVGTSTYFEKVLDLYKKQNFDQSLTEAKILPSMKMAYLKEDVIKAISKPYPGVTVDIVCKQGTFSSPVLTQVRLCYDKSMKVVNCQPRATECESSKIMILPLQGDGSPDLSQPPMAAPSLMATSSVVVVLLATIITTRLVV